MAKVKLVLFLIALTMNGLDQKAEIFGLDKTPGSKYTLSTGDTF